jgi:hypothetical protein
MYKIKVEMRINILHNYIINKENITILITGSRQEISSNAGNYIRNPKDILTSPQTKLVL